MDDLLQALGFEPLTQFRAIARHRSLRAAADALHLSPPALTRALQRLEDRLDATLCTRGRKGFALTDDGRRVLELAERVLAEAEQILGDGTTTRAGILSVGVLGSGMVPEIRAGLLRTLDRHPDTRLNLTIATSDRIDRLVAEGELDVGVSVFDRRRERLRYSRIASQPFRYYISKAHPLWKKRDRIARSDLAGQRVVWVDHERVPTKELAHAVFRDDPKQLMRVWAFTNDLDGAFQLLLAGFAVVPMPRDFMEPYLKQRLVKELPIRPRVNQLTTEVVYDPSLPLRPAVECLLRELGALG